MQAGFEDAATEVEKRLAANAKTADTVKEFLTRIQPFTSEAYHASLSEALAQVEAETNSSVSMDSSSEGYKKFAAKVQVREGVCSLQRSAPRRIADAACAQSSHVFAASAALSCLSGCRGCE